MLLAFLLFRYGLHDSANSVDLISPMGAVSLIRAGYRRMYFEPGGQELSRDEMPCCGVALLVGGAMDEAAFEAE